MRNRAFSRRLLSATAGGKTIRRIRRTILAGVVLAFLAINSAAQTISFYPKGDSLSFWGTCTPPGMSWHLLSDSSGVDKIVIHRYACELIHGSPIQVKARFDSAWFSINDPHGHKSYELWMTNLSTYHGGTFQVPPDTIYYLYSGPIILKLLVIRQSIVVDSAKVSGFAFQTGLAVEERAQNIPGSVRLHQNFPNPFNGQTTVTYEVPTAGHVDVQVIDLLGRRIAILKSEFQPAGTHTLYWDATAVASGTYFITLNTAGKRSVINCQLMK